MTITVYWEEKQQNKQKQSKLLSSNVNALFRDYMFDSKMRAKRSAKPKLATIADVDHAAKGVGRIRQHHH